jgi:hypothetical protein
VRSSRSTARCAVVNAIFNLSAAPFIVMKGFVPQEFDYTQRVIVETRILVPINPWHFPSDAHG